MKETTDRSFNGGSDVTITAKGLVQWWLEFNPSLRRLAPQKPLKTISLHKLSKFGAVGSSDGPEELALPLWILTHYRIPRKQSQA